MTTDRPRHLGSWAAYLWTTVLFPGRSAEPTATRRSAILILLFLPALLLYPTLNFRLLEPDEGRYAQIPREMLARGEWVVPTLQGQPYLDKPPLLYWLVMASYSVFGVSEAAARLIPAIATHLTILLVYLIGRRSLGERSAFWGALLLGITPGFVGMGRLLIMDGLLTMWVTLALLAGFEAVRGPTLRRGWWYLAAVACGFGVLTKGPIPLILLAPPMLMHGWLTGQRAAIGWKHVVGFLSVVLLVNLPWYAGIFLRQPVFLRYFFWEHNIMRFIKPFDHLEPVWFYMPVMLAGLLPGTLLLLAFARHLMSGDESLARTRTPELGFWLLAGGWCVLFFSLSGCKLPTYVLPAFPCLLLALGDFVAKTRWQSAWQTRTGVTCSAALMVFAFYVAIPWYADLRSPMGPPAVADKLLASNNETIYCFPRNVDSVAFYTGRDDLKSMRSKQSQELIETLMTQDHAVVLFTHRHSLESFKAVLPPQLMVAEATPVRHRGTGANFLDKIVGDGPWGLCDVAVIQKVPKR
ncbi:ArnT family glycosyltransferase [Zavarzinella formosa]|uniref:ArnT family glycosyltransferase n=1 Tax=Zavarzinella formosa TaxID=360055 RepID=UPI000316D644|nr:glycosyltransferase family 39 protein [Zavarzinella formosa]